MSAVISNLTKSYGSQKAVDDISFKLSKGEIVGFIGPNGSGKSTTMKSICGVISSDSGTILVDNKNVTESPTLVKKYIGYLPENNPLYFDMYVEEYLRHIGKIYKIKNLKNRVKEVVDQTGLSPEKHKKIEQLSKGYKQRVGIAQALIHDPDLLILDEPTTGLDPNQLTEIRALIKSLGKDKTVLLSTHILQEVEAICDRVIMISKGKIVSDSTPEEAKKNTTNTQTLRVEFKEHLNPDLFNQIEGVQNYKISDNNVVLFESEEGEDLRERIFQFALSNNFSILEMQTIKRSLEDAFKELSSN